VSEYRKELLKSAIVAIISASLLGAVIYHVFQPEHGLMPVVFAFGEGEQFSGDYSLLESSCVVLGFTFLNGSVITSPLPSLEDMNRGVSIPNECIGEFNATELKKIILSVSDFDDFFYNRDSALRYLVTWLRDRIISAKLVESEQEITELGTSTSLGRNWNIQSGRIGDPKEEHYKLLLDALKASFNITVKELSSTGYWKASDYIWAITADQLNDILHGSGTINITFTLDIKTELEYKIIRTSEEDLTGKTTLEWTGTSGTLQLTHEEGKISWLKYNFKTVKLIMVVNV